MGECVKVIVRIRPLSSKETEEGRKVLVIMYYYVDYDGIVYIDTSRLLPIFT